jgi:hypothetical protein
MVNLIERPPTPQDPYPIFGFQALVGMHPGRQGIQPVQTKEKGGQENEVKGHHLDFRREGLERRIRFRRGCP